MLAKRISATPVVGPHGELLGIVSEGDLMRRAETKTARQRPWWLALMTSTEISAADFIKSHSWKVSDVMTRSVITARPDSSLCEIAELLETNLIKRVPIVDDGKVVGIVSRANLLQAFASLPDPRPMTSAGADDQNIREKVAAQWKAQDWAEPWPLNIIVHDGIVELWGLVESETAKRAIGIAAEEVEGVRAVRNNLVVRPILAYDH
jgi:signal-transduction protein with cAMP-binding, CBS, and nucleotidyltransferase domain